MSNYRRNRVPEGTYFFTVNLLERNSRLLIEHIDAFRDAVRQVRTRRPFHIDAWVVLADHTHCIWTRPPNDTDYSSRWKGIKTANQPFSGWNSIFPDPGMTFAAIDRLVHYSTIFELNVES